jgi:hypothetical protein
MRNFKTLLIIMSLLYTLSCEKEISITEFRDDFSNYEAELRIEAIILPTENTAIVRVDKSVLITDISLYDCVDDDYGRTTEQECIDVDGFWHGDTDSTIANCGDWNPLLHDVGIDGKIGDTTDDNGNCESCSFTDTICQENCRDEDSIGENNGVPDCNEPNVDNYNEFLSNIHISPDEDGNNGCEISITKVNSSTGITDEICEFIFDPSAGNFWITGNVSIDEFYTVDYGGYVPNGCSNTMWSNEYGNMNSEYNFTADCSAAGFGIVTSKESITVSEPVIFVDAIQNSISEIPETQTDIAEYLERLGIRNCSDYNCLEEKKLSQEDDFIYFPRYSQSSSIIWATISPNVYFEATQYMYDSTMVSKYFHGHPSVGTDFFNIVDDVCLMGEALFSDYFDGYGNGEWDDGSDSEAKDSAEIFADENGNGIYDEGEFFIDRVDNIGDIDTYYYKISTFSESYKNYYYYSQLLPNDPERSNLRDENMNPIMGAFGSITTNQIDFQIIDCLEFIDDEASCIDGAKTHGVCSWYPNVVINDFTGPACLPINWTF